MNEVMLSLINKTYEIQDVYQRYLEYGYLAFQAEDIAAEDIKNGEQNGYVPIAVCKDSKGRAYTMNALASGKK